MTSLDKVELAGKYKRISREEADVGKQKLGRDYSSQRLGIKYTACV